MGASPSSSRASHPPSPVPVLVLVPTFACPPTGTGGGSKDDGISEPIALSDAANGLAGPGLPGNPHPHPWPPAVNASGSNRCASHTASRVSLIAIHPSKKDSTLSDISPPPGAPPCNAPPVRSSCSARTRRSARRLTTRHKMLNCSPPRTRLVDVASPWRCTGPLRPPFGREGLTGEEVMDNLEAGVLDDRPPPLVGVYCRETGALILPLSAPAATGFDKLLRAPSATTAVALSSSSSSPLFTYSTRVIIASLAIRRAPA